ncbi:hypothetical protein ACFC5T_17400 [Streptomyces sp. NPDC055961]|uniref:hypothetical protein n=1 Tax=Streptomyces sp. NPDC055961 TaxID=3345666 RepID=UPI0035DB4A3E
MTRPADENEIVDAELLEDNDPGPGASQDDEDPDTTPYVRMLLHLARRLAAREAKVLATGARHTAGEFRRWRTAEDLTDAHVARDLLNTQYRLWQTAQRKKTGLARAQISRLEAHNKRQMQLMLQGRGPGPTPATANAIEKWAKFQAKVEMVEFEPAMPTPVAVTVGRGQIRRRRARRFHATAVGLTVVDGLGLTLFTGPVVVTDLVLAAATATVLWVQGRVRTTLAPALPHLTFPYAELPEEIEPAEEPVAGDDWKPFPIRQAENAEQVEECLFRALSVDADIAQVTDASRLAYGWQAIAVLNSGTPADIVRLLPKLDVALRVGQGRTMAQGGYNPNDSAEVMVRVLTEDPFANPPAFPLRNPLSCSILKPVSIGISIDGEPTDVILAGQHILIVAKSGGGKSAMVRTLAEYATACSDAVVWDLDPTGRGLGPLRGLAGRTAYTEEEIEAALADLVRYAENRIAALDEGEDNWVVTDEEPALIAFLDEYSKLSKKAKEHALALIRIGRKARITLVICTQDATSDIMGDAVADSFGIRVMLPCRMDDVPIVVGDRSAISAGWLPHLLVPSPGEWDIADAGRFYCLTPRHRAPILRYCPHLDAGTALLRAKERLNVGLPSLDAVTTGDATRRPVPRIAQLLLDAFESEGWPAQMTVDELHGHLRAADVATWGRWDDRTDRLAMVGRTLQAELKKAALTIPTVRITDRPSKPTAYRFQDIQEEIKRSSQ